MAVHFQSNSQLLTCITYKAAANHTEQLQKASSVATLQVLLLIPVFLIPAFLPRQSAYAKSEVQAPRRTLEVWAANHYREEAPVASTSDSISHSHTYLGGFEGDTPHGFEGDTPHHHSSTQHHTAPQHHVSPQHTSAFEGDVPQHHISPVGQTQHSVLDSSDSRVAGAPFDAWSWSCYSLSVA